MKDVGHNPTPGFIHNSLPLLSFFRAVFYMRAGNTFVSNTRALLNEPGLKSRRLLSAGTEERYPLSKEQVVLPWDGIPTTVSLPLHLLASAWPCRSSSPNHSPARLHTSPPGRQQAQPSGTGRKEPKIEEGWLWWIGMWDHLEAPLV